MAGIGELLASLFGSQKAGGAESEKAGVLSSTVAGIASGMAKIPGNPLQVADMALKAKSVSDNRDGVLEALSAGDAGLALKRSGLLTEEASDATLEAFDTLASALSGRTAQAQLEALIGRPIPPEATTTKAVMDQLALLTQTNEAIQALSVGAEIASLGQVDRLGAELRSYLDYSGVSQISGFGYGQILGTVIGSRMSQEMLAVSRPSIPSVLDLATMRQRNLITDETFNDNMARMGYSDDISSSLYETAKYYPGPQDWIRFAVRDVFNPAIVESAGLNEQFPDDIVPYAEKGGVSEEFMRMHWRAHWNLPSPNQAYEMYHRGFIAIDDLRALLKAADYAPGYIDGMVGIASTPYTRVDARRMYDAGVLDDAGYTRALKDLGYDDEKAGHLLEFARSDGASKEKDLSMTQMLKAYSLGKVATADIITYLVGTGYDAEEAALLVELEDAKKDETILKEKVAVLDWYYARGDISDSEYLDALASEAIPRVKANYYLSLAALDAEKKAKLPSKADVEKWLKKEYISDSQARQYLRQIGYRDAETALYMQEWTDEIQASGGESNA
ncbi:MAG: hypothetical protein PHQ41_04020 [Candidatus Cloacimonetes bacterium]|nr:hypothetical protein [Candidatus Cloacimonadota bacterium]